MRGKDSLLVMAVALAAGAGAFLVSFDGTPALAQGKPDAGNMIAIPVAVNSAQEALCLIDVGNGIVAVYEIDQRFRITLKAAREFIWDIQIRELNTTPKPDQVKSNIERIEVNRKRAEEKAAKLKK